MKNRIGLIVLSVGCIALIIALVIGRKEAAERQKADTEQMIILTNNLEKSNAELDDQKKVNTALEKDLDQEKKAVLELTNNVTQLTTKVAEEEAKETQTESKLQTAEQEIKERDSKIADLEAQNHALDLKAEELTNAITALNVQIDDTKRRLASAEGDKAFLQKQLERLTAEKNELESKFSNLAVLREQINKIKTELVVSRRLEYKRAGVYANDDQRGATRLMQGPPMIASKGPKENYDLNVEVNSDGSVRIIPPLTNRPPSNGVPPPK